MAFAMLMMMMATATVKAENETVNNESVNFKFRIQLREMNKTMHLYSYQIEGLRAANIELCKAIASLETVPADERKNVLNGIVIRNLSTVHKLTDDDQYRAYLTLLNNEFNKHGLNNILFGFNTLAEK